MNKKVRVRFAPSPTGGLHLGGVRTALYNYLFAKHYNGDFIIRIEDTDQTRFVQGAEEYIFNCMKWIGLEPDESPLHGGEFGPYRQSERKEIYRPYAEQLVKDGHAYYAFDTQEELEKMRQEFKTERNPSPQYDHTIRMKMRNSLTLPGDEVKAMLEGKVPHVIRIKMSDYETVSFTDMIRGNVSFDAVVDDKVLLKADGMPTYHLAVVVDDYLMKITHAFRGEEWLSSAPVHILLWKYLFGLENMPQWAHLPLILGPNGKLSKRDGAKYGFPVFAMNWKDPKTEELIEGFKEKGFLPEAFINFLALLGWNDGTEQEIFTKEELITKFSMERVHSGGAKFDFGKAVWFNHKWLSNKPDDWIADELANMYPTELNSFTKDYLIRVISITKERCSFIRNFMEEFSFFFKSPEQIDTASILPKWNEQKKIFFAELIRTYQLTSLWKAEEIEKALKEMAAAHQIKPGELMMPFRIMLVGGKFGPAVFDIAEILGKEETISRIEKTLSLLS